jgi:hypothetical protein
MEGERARLSQSGQSAKRPLGLIARDLRGLLTPLTRPFDEIDAYALNQLLSELEAASQEQGQDALRKLREWLVHENEGHKKSRRKFHDIDQKMACDSWIQANEWTIQKIDHALADSHDDKRREGQGSEQSGVAP